jgi:hypothetical protein
MATAYTSPRAVKKFPPRTATVAAGLTSNLYDVSGSISTWASGDTITFPALPVGAVVTGARLLPSNALDSNGSPTLHVEVGYAGAPAAFMAATAIDSAAVSANTMTAPLAADTPVVVTVSTAAATAAAGALALAVEYFVEPAAGSNP